MRIADRPVGPGVRPFVIAEMSGNHNQSLDRALAIVDAAADARVDALKLQTYSPDTMTIDLDEREFHIADPASPWTGRSLYRLYGEACTPWEWHAPLFARARARGLIAFSTPFDESAVTFLESLDVPCYKIASFENTDLPLIRRVAATGKPVIISTGMASQPELEDAVAAARGAGCRDLVLLKCTSTYPASPEHSNLATIPDLRARFDCEIGLSDHTAGTAVAIAAVALGATMIEKHLTLARADGGPDGAFSLEPAEMAEVVRGAKLAFAALGDGSARRPAAESGSRKFRRSLYAVEDIAPGEPLTRSNVRSIRPGFGLPPRVLPTVLGRRAKQAIVRGTALAWEMIE